MHSCEHACNHPPHCIRAHSKTVCYEREYLNKINALIIVKSRISEVQTATKDIRRRPSHQDELKYLYLSPVSAWKDSHLLQSLLCLP